MTAFPPFHCAVTCVCITYAWNMQDFWIAGVIFGSIYVPTAVVAMISSTSQASTSSSPSAIVLGLIHILITLVMHVLRFSCQV